jgi:hypothetical protein
MTPSISRREAIETVTLGGAAAAKAVDTNHKIR